MFDDVVRRRLTGHLAGVDPDFRALGHLVRGIDAREVEELSPASLLIETLAVAGLSDGKGGIDMHLYEFPLCELRSCHVSLRLKWRDERHEHNESGVNHQVHDLGHTPDVLDSIGVGETQILVQPVPDVVAVEQIRVPATFM